MCSHEQKNCPRCNNLFECKVGSILQCQCYTVNLSEVEKQYIDRHYSDCLCARCLKEIKKTLQQLPN